MSTRVFNAISGRLSLRPPQADSLARLKQAVDAAPSMLTHDERDVDAILATLKGEFPTLQDFEREFPSLCFALATGVGKTRLMGAFIAYLHLAHGINNFFVLAPNLTIYDKLIADFTRNTPKYVFKGIAEFAQQAPLIITGDNYDQTGAAVDAQPQGFAHDVRINIFNISKINSEVRGGKEPRIKRMKEVLGDSYFNHLASLDDLVLLMDESHRYRASAGVRSINELNPLFGLELTATPFIEANPKPIPFKNVVMDYPLAKAMEDGFVKEPAVATQRGFDARALSEGRIEEIKLQDGIRLHETTKVELLTYARESGEKLVKPFMLVIARDTSHAAQLLSQIESDEFYGGRYRGKVIQVDSSSTKGVEGEEIVQKLLAIESPDEPTEIVIHVNMLKEGWDVTNLYTIVPLRAGNARTLIEQSIGRGLRLPYGKRTGVEAVDRLSIVAHDKFQEIVDEANRGDSPIRLKQIILDAPSADDRKVSVTVTSAVDAMLSGSTGVADNSSTGTSVDPVLTPYAQAPVFASDVERQVAHRVLDVITSFGSQPGQVPSSAALTTPELQRRIAAEVRERLTPAQTDLLGGVHGGTAAVDVVAIVAKATEIFIQKTIDIPRIAVVPSGDVTTGFDPFELDVSQLRLQPNEREIVVHNLHTNVQTVLRTERGTHEARAEDYLIRELVNYDDVDYFTQSDLLYELAGQMVTHLHSYLSEEETITVLDGARNVIAREIHSQMQAHFWERATSYEVRVSRGFTELKPCNYTAVAGQEPRNYRETVTETGKIKQMLFGGFQRCLYPLQKFDSDTERRFAVILERDALKWMKPAKGQFQIYYKLGADQPEYMPDFVVETDACIYMAETKARTDMKAPDVLAKSEAAAQWCKHASGYAATIGSKPWKYLLIPHDEVQDARRLAEYERYLVVDCPYSRDSQKGT
jgi:type III restriction enzyme